MDAYPMVERSMRAQSEYYTYYGCITCGHEATRKEDMHVFDCHWCGTDCITPVWLKPKLVNDQLVVEKAEWSYVDLSG